MMKVETITRMIKRTVTMTMTGQMIKVGTVTRKMTVTRMITSTVTIMTTGTGTVTCQCQGG